MNAKDSLAWTIFGCCGVVAILATGCSRWFELTSSADQSIPGGIAQSIARQERVPLLLDQVQFNRNGAPQNPSPETEQRLLETFREIGLFARTGSMDSAGPAADEKAVHARILIDEMIDPHPGDAAWKGIVIGASMFLLTPIIPLQYDYASYVNLELERWDGQIKRYESQSAGTGHYHLFGATPLMIDELKGHVMESCLAALMRQVVQDTSFYAASSAPLPDNSIRSVLVKPRPSRGSTTPFVPVSAPSGR